MDSSPKLTVEDLRRAGIAVTNVRFAEQAAAFRSQPADPGGIAFVGDSDIRLWDEGGRLGRDFAPLPVVSRGFGGARTWETLLFFDDLVPSADPATIVYNCGDNDIAALKSADGARSAVEGFRMFLELLASRTPRVRRVIYLSIHPAPADEPLWGFQRQANDRIREICDRSPLAEFADYLHLLIDPGGRLDTGAFRSDGLHFSDDFYRRWAAWLRPRLERA